MKLDIMDVYDIFDEMEKLKKYKKPEHDYFPSLAEINTKAFSANEKYMIPYLLWLDANLSQDGIKKNADAVKRLREITSDMEEITI